MLGDRPKAGEGHPSLPPVDLRLERSKLEASLSRRLRTDRSSLATCGPADLLPLGEGSTLTLSPDWGDLRRPR